ncbi:MAG: hypothetical protein Q9219_006777 [cf. Caloplaca sp. 3 TL-2023]
MPYPTPPADIASPAGQSKNTQSKTATGRLAAEALLTIYNINLRRNSALSIELNLKIPRDISTTPNSKWVKALKERRHKLHESTGLYALAKHLLYDPSRFPGDEGEEMVAMELDQQWIVNVPKPAGFSDDTDLQRVMERYGLPSRPKPDVIYGYDATAFPDPLLNRIKGLPQELSVYFDEPWLPWQTVRWKTAKGN